MKVEIDIESSNRTKICRFARKCLEDFDKSWCCEIIKEGSHYLIISPVSTFKSSNCSYLRQITDGKQNIHICSCPVRLAIFRKYKI